MKLWIPLIQFCKRRLIELGEPLIKYYDDNQLEVALGSYQPPQHPAFIAEGTHHTGKGFKQMCECFNGYEGENCEKQLCRGEPGPCSGHGQCTEKKAKEVLNYIPTMPDVSEMDEEYVLLKSICAQLSLMIHSRGSDTLLSSMLPREIARSLRETGCVAAKHHTVSLLIV